MRSKKSWHERLHDSKNLPEVKPIPPRMRRTRGSGTIVIPAPVEVDEIIRQVPRGRLITAQQIADRLAIRHDTTIGCAVTSGIFAWIAAYAADEAEAAGKTSITPYWRVLKAGGELNAKYPGGIRNLRRRLAREGHRFHQREGRVWVVDYETRLLGVAE